MSIYKAVLNSNDDSQFSRNTLSNYIRKNFRPKKRHLHISPEIDQEQMPMMDNHNGSSPSSPADITNEIPRPLSRISPISSIHTEIEPVSQSMTKKALTLDFSSDIFTIPITPTNYMNAQRAQQQQRVPHNPYQNMGNSPQKQIDSSFFFQNSQLRKKNWPILWNTSGINKVPLKLERSDKSIVFTDDTKKAKPLPWDKMNFEEGSYYQQLQDTKSTSVDINLQHMDVAKNLSLIDSNITDFLHFHHPVHLPTQTE